MVLKKIAEPIGVVAAVIPTTNPTSTAIFKVFNMFKDKKCNNNKSASKSQRNVQLQAAKVVLGGSS